jgi:large subunit ribosomal protein L24
MKTKLKKGQTVQLITGADKGKSGEIIKLFPKNYSALVKGVNVKKKHQKPTKEQKGGIVSIEKPVHLSNLKIIDGKKSQEKSKKQDTKKTEAKAKKTEAKTKKTEAKTKKTAVKKKVAK